VELTSNVPVRAERNKEESLEIKADFAAAAPLWRWTFEAALALPSPQLRSLERVHH
jgi:hypothetical protein